MPMYDYEERINYESEFGDKPRKGLWYEIYDFSDRDYGSDWGYVLFFNGKEVERMSGFSRSYQAIDVARKAKEQYKLRKMKR